MKIAALIARVLLGIMFTVFGLNGFMHFIPMPPLPAGPAQQFMGAMAESHYLHPVFAIQLVCGVLFLVGRYVPLALTLIGPVIVNILLFHLTMAPSGIAPGALATILWFVVFARYREAFAGLFVV
jgi:putative oxidoreductase